MEKRVANTQGTWASKGGGEAVLIGSYEQARQISTAHERILS